MYKKTIGYEKQKSCNKVKQECRCEVVGEVGGWGWLSNLQKWSAIKVPSPFPLLFTSVLSFGTLRPSGHSSVQNSLQTCLDHQLPHPSPSTPVPHIIPSPWVLWLDIELYIFCEIVRPSIIILSFAPLPVSPPPIPSPSSSLCSSLFFFF